MSSARTSWCGGHAQLREPVDARSSGRPRASAIISPRAPAARRSVRFTISPTGRPSMAACGSSTKRAGAIPQPVVAAGLPARAVHPLLHDHPGAVVGDDEAVQVEVEAVLQGGAVDLGDEAAGAHQRRRVQPHPLAERGQLVGRAARVPAAPAADVQPQLVFNRRRGPRLSAPITLVVIPDECQSIPITAPNDWNQNGFERRRNTSVRPYSCAIASTITRPSRAIRAASQAGTRPP